MKGRKPLPTAIKEATGALKHDPQRRNNAEPTTKRGYPACPATIAVDEVAKQCWNETCELLDEMGILTTSDKRVLHVYCVTYSEWLFLSEYVKNGNVRLANDRGNETTSPEAGQVHKYADRLLKLLAELGLTPSSRSRLHVEKKEDDPFADFMKASMNRN
jgi:P27 family predicted phage terminase small subunit